MRAVSSLTVSARREGGRLKVSWLMGSDQGPVDGGQREVADNGEQRETSTGRETTGGRAQAPKPRTHEAKILGHRHPPGSSHKYQKKGVAGGAICMSVK